MGAEAEDDAVHFTLTRVEPETGDELEEPKSFSLTPGEDSRVRLGRGPLCDVVVASRHASTYHCELRVLRPDGAQPRLSVTDLSMNGTGLTKPSGGGTAHLEKNQETPVSDGSMLYVPMTLKANTDPSQRAHFKLHIVGDGEASGEAKPKHKKHKKKHKQKKGEEVDEEEAADGSGGSQDDAQDDEQKRMIFVELLLKTKQVSAGTSYKEAEKLLSGKTEWASVKEATRKECFEIFVEHLGSHGGKQKDKNKKAKGKEKETARDKGKKHKKGDENGDKADRRKRRSRSRDSPERKHRRRHRRGKGSGGSGSPPAKRRRRAAESSASS